MDRIAEALGMDPVRLREINALRPGDTTATGQVLGRDAAALDVLRAAVARSDFRRKRRACRGTNRGIGLSLFFHGAGFTGSGEVKLRVEGVARAHAGRRADPRGQHRDRPGPAHGARADRRRRARPSATTPSRWPPPTPRRCPTAGPTVASRTTMVVGGLLQRCARRCARRLGRLTPRAYLRSARSARRHEAVRAAAGPGVGRRDLSRLRLRIVRLGLRRHRGRARSGDARRSGPIRVTTVHEIGKAHLPARRARPDRGRHRAGPRLRADRGGRDARRRHGQRAADQLHRADDARHAADGRRAASRSRTRTGRSARRASARCPSTAWRRRWSTRSAASASTSGRSRRRRSGSWRRAGDPGSPSRRPGFDAGRRQAPRAMARATARR